MPVLNATIASPTANSYLTIAEATEYFDGRLPLSVPWVASGHESALMMATRTLDSLAQPFKTFFAGPPAYYRIRRQWTGSPATTTQRLAWPRTTLFDCNGNALDTAITTVSAANPAVVTTDAPHRLQSGQEVLLFGVVDSDPDVNGARVATVLTTTTFSIPVTVTTPGRGGRITVIPQRLKDATAELAGQLLIEDRTLDNDVIIQGINSLRAGSVSLGFNKDLIQQVIPQAVYDMLCYGWLTDEGYEMALKAMFDVVSD